jgi:putative acetyltransferase
MLIRPFKREDGDALAELFHASVREIGPRDYSPEQVAAWSARKPDPARYANHASERLILVAEDGEGSPAGYIILERDGHIDHLYCRPDRVGTGVGAALYAEVEAVARRLGMARLSVEASEGARRLFERRGFTIDARNDFAIESVAIHHYAMSKAIV